MDNIQLVTLAEARRLIAEENRIAAQKRHAIVKRVFFGGVLIALGAISIVAGISAEAGIVLPLMGIAIVFCTKDGN